MNHDAIMAYASRQVLDLDSRRGHPNNAETRTAMNGCPQYEDMRKACSYLRSPCRVWPMGFTDGAVVTATATTIRQNPQYDFTGELLQTDSENDESFVINDIRVGTRTQMAADGAIAASMFSQLNLLNPMNFDHSKATVNWDLVVTHTAVGNQSFGAIVFGRMAD